jgi:mono/diheme cytochrome c family protein
MKRFVWIVGLAAPALLHAQSQALKRGAEVFRTTCAGAYCHGSEGTAGRAPRLAGRNFNPRVLSNIIQRGKPGTGMPAFSQKLKTEDIQAVSEYVLSLSSSAEARTATEKPAVRELPPSAVKGRALFFDAVRMGGCGKCHELEDRGSPVATDLAALAPEHFRNLRDPSSKSVVTASPSGEDAFPALVAEQTPERIRVYDLSSALPVLRTFQAAEVRITPGNKWSHAAAVETYSQADLEAISIYLTWVVGTPK